MSNEFDYDSNPGTSQQNQQQVPTPQQGRAPRARPERPAAPKAIRHRISRAAIMRTRAAAVLFPQ